MSLQVLGGNVSPFVRKVRTFLAEKGVDYEHVPVNPFAPPDGWREISPLGRIPVLRDGDRTLPDSSVICTWLERRFPEPALYPADDWDHARALWIEEFIDGGVVPLVGPRVFFALVLQPLMSRKEPDAATEERARKVLEEEAPPLWDHLERELGDADFFVGNRLSIADIAVASPFVNLRHAGYRPEAARWPRLAAFLERMHGRPSMKALIEEETPVFGKRAARA